MKVSSVSSSNVFQQIIHKPEKIRNNNYSQNSNNKTEVLLNALAIFGIASIAIATSKKGINYIKNNQNKIHKIFYWHKDPVVRALKGKRNAEAVEIYKKLMNQKKYNSLQKRFNLNEFKDKSSQALHHILDNSANLQRVI